MLEYLGRHSPQFPPVTRHTGSKHSLDLGVAVLGQIASQVGRVALVKRAALQLLAMTTAAAECPAYALAVRDARRCVGDLRSVERGFSRLLQRFRLLLARPREQQNRNTQVAHLSCPPAHRIASAGLNRHNVRFPPKPAGTRATRSS